MRPVTRIAPCTFIHIPQCQFSFFWSLFESNCRHTRFLKTDLTDPNIPFHTDIFEYVNGNAKYGRKNQTEWSEN